MENVVDLVSYFDERWRREDSFARDTATPFGERGDERKVGGSNQS